MEYPKVLPQKKDKAGQPWEESDVVDHHEWSKEFCNICIHQHPHPDGEPQCRILDQYIHLLPYPADEWVYSKDGWQICTEWEFWDWENDGNPLDHNNPNSSIQQPEDPDQNELTLDK